MASFTFFLKNQHCTVITIAKKNFNILCILNLKKMVENILK